MRRARGQFGLNQLLPVAILVVVIGLVVAFGLDITDDMGADFVDNTAGCNSTDKTSCGYAYNATQDSLEAGAKTTSKMPLIIGAIVAVIIISVLVRAFGGLNRT